MKNKKIYVLGFAFLMIFSACKKDKVTVTNPPAPTNEEELITTFKITFIDPTNTNPDVVAIFRDIDGPGGNAPTLFDTLRLKSNTVYNASIQFLNEAVNPIQDITPEILEEATDHLVCFSPSGVNLQIIRTDSDGQYEIGLRSKWATGNASSGNTVISLRHQPGIKNGTCAVGDTDIELNFVTIIAN